MKFGINDIEQTWHPTLDLNTAKMRKVKKLKSFRGQKTLREMSQLMKMTTADVAKIIYEFGINYQKENGCYLDDYHEQMKSELRTAKQWAQLTGANIQTVYDYAKKHNIELEPDLRSSKLRRRAL